MSRKRTRARRRALQALYQWQMTGQDLGEIERQFLEDEDMRDVELDYFRELLHQVPARLAELDGVLAPLLDRPIGQVDPVERAVLRIGVYELAHRLEVPYRVVINEAIELAKRFGSEHGHRYVNGILDKAARSLRAVEVEAAGR
ncbi:transcription antitermination factor NusB [Inmirania thermothiophila]|uniref:Transcription antitermination protein NusB n=1 Tax=Inmirania thermothiophila TaxID=1750597 RepID=A0A3N1Y8Z5_9GAMM|nr:transcription antitermination factor NusB [Inmirania thermothiophila]ROR34968.1 NusB antitermination factor [Inmirania thermothiophila]